MHGKDTHLGSNQPELHPPFWEHLFGQPVPIPRISDRPQTPTPTHRRFLGDSTNTVTSSPESGGIGIFVNSPRMIPTSEVNLWYPSSPQLISPAPPPNSSINSSINSSPTSYTLLPFATPTAHNEDPSAISAETWGNLPYGTQIIYPESTIDVSMEKEGSIHQEEDQEKHQGGKGVDENFVFPSTSPIGPYTQPQTAEPFTRKSKWGMSHTVTPMRATQGFVCTFPTTPLGVPCNKRVALPHQMRKHLIETHAQFSPFQCEHCKRVYARSCMRHKRMLKCPNGILKCPNEFVKQDAFFLPRRQVANAINAIQKTQAEVNCAVKLILYWNGKIEPRKRRNTKKRGGGAGGAEETNMINGC